MIEITVVSGKGGTGKTTVSAALVQLALEKGLRPVAVDADVDAANLALLLSGDDLASEPFFAGERAVIDADRCSGCGECVDACQFNAVKLSDDGLAEVDLIRCEGCRVCGAVCPEDAVTMTDNRAGQLMVRQGDCCLVHAELGVAQDNSGKLVAAVRSRARAEAEKRGADLILIDGPPGIGCPVHAAVTGAKLLLAVTEPTPSGAHDLARLLELAKTFTLPAAVLVNKADLSPLYVNKIKELAKEHQAPVVGLLPFDPQIPRRLSLRQIPLDVLAWAEALRRAFKRVQSLTNIA